MKSAFHFWSSSLGKKAAMALSGVVLFGFVLMHMLGNLKVFYGGQDPAELNIYAAWLRSIGEPALPHAGALWIARSVLFVALVVHVTAALQLTLQNRRARPAGYQRKTNVQLDYASRSMIWTGALLLVYVVYHLLHLTFGTLHPHFVEGDVYNNLTIGLGVWPIALVYMAANLLLGLHLYHGLWSIFQTLGISSPLAKAVRRPLAALLALIVSAGFLSVPMAVVAGRVVPVPRPAGVEARSTPVEAATSGVPAP